MIFTVAHIAATRPPCPVAHWTPSQPEGRRFDSCRALLSKTDGRAPERDPHDRLVSTASDDLVKAPLARHALEGMHAALHELDARTHDEVLHCARYQDFVRLRLIHDS